MFNFLQKPSSVRCGAIVDVGSGSVGVSIVISKNTQDRPVVVWSHREFCLIKSEVTQEMKLNEIKTTIVRALLELGNAGAKALHNYQPSLHIAYVQCAVAAPWSHTVTKTISFEDEHPFVITEELLAQLTNSARKQADDTLTADELSEKLGLTITDSQIINFKLNGYSIQNPINQKCRTVSLSYLHAAVWTDITKTLEESTEKILPKADLTIHSFMYVFYSVLKHMKPDTSEMCLIDVTKEATEIGIIREGILKFVTHVEIGAFTLAREIVEACKLTREEAFSILKNNNSVIVTKLSETAKIGLEKVFERYEDSLKVLFTKTGDELSIPKSVFLHTNESLEDFFVEHMRNATERGHTIHKVTEDLLKEEQTEDTALALSETYFHTSHGKSLF